ncbi:hypothetical protein GCM10023328_39100 [Modestobacter marinus]|uniref:Uncharacterized protein n=1 Tax=Modestobacter marinus TaxID=477641 RepID=A0ABQ2G5N1_9ACTN|nr:hypothetical protein GCM10011589_35790 [Modestobacter marinus]
MDTAGLAPDDHELVQLAACWLKTSLRLSLERQGGVLAWTEDHALMGLALAQHELTEDRSFVARLRRSA